MQANVLTLNAKLSTAIWSKLCMISWEILIFYSAWKQFPVLSYCKQCFCWIPEPSHHPGRMPLTNPQGFLIKCDWIEPPVPRRRTNLYLSYFLFLHLFLFSQQQDVYGRKRPVNCLPPRICTSFPQWACFWNMKGSEQNGKFPLHLPCSQSVRSDPDKECDIDDDSNKDVFSPQAFLLIRLICGENKWILTKCKRVGVLGGLDKRVWQAEEEVEIQKVSRG